MYTINNGSVQNFQLFCFNHESRFEEILGLSKKCFAINRKIGLEEVEKNEGWARTGDKKTLVTPPRGFKTVPKAPPYGQFQILVLLKKLKIASLCMDNSRES